MYFNFNKFRQNILIVKTNIQM